MFRFVDFSGELFAITLETRLTGIFRRRIVIDVAVQRAQTVCQLFQWIGQVTVSRSSIGPHRVTAIRRDNHTAQDGYFWIINNEGHIGMPRIGSGFLGVQVQDGGALLGGPYGWMRYLIAEAPGKSFVLGITQMLVAEEYNFIFQQCLINEFELFSTDVPTQFHAIELCTNSTSNGFNLNCHRATSCLTTCC